MKDNKFIVNKPPTKSPLVHVDDSESILNFFDQTNPDIDLFNLIDDETIRISGSKVAVYKYYPSEEYDEVYMESRSKTVSKEPVILFAHYEPKAVEQALGQFGIEVDNDQVFTFNKLYAERKLGRPLIVGDVIIPQFQNMKYRVYQVSEDSYEVYGVYHLMCYCNLLRDSEDMFNRDVRDTPPNLGRELDL